MSFERKNLAYVVRPTINKENELVHILESVKGSAIVYVRSRKRTKEYADMLNKAGIKATFFHAGLDNQVKDQRQRQWQDNSVRVIVATNAFGMGIDKPDVRAVVHMDCPDSLEAYFQEAGRAGRDGKKSYAVLLTDGTEKMKLKKRIVDTFPEKDYIRAIYDQLAYFYQIGVGSGYNHVFEFPIDKFCHNFRHFPTRVLSSLKILQRAGYISYQEEEEGQARLRFRLERDDLYRLRDNGTQADALIVALLRNYSGLFNDYVYIDEAFLAQQTGLTRPQVYLILKELGRRGIVDFIPQRSTPLIRYTQRREDSAYLQLPPAVYDDLKERYRERIEKMIEYATSDNRCRSRMLLHYFGQDDAKDCGQCDVCLERRSTLNKAEDADRAQTLIEELLADGKQHHVSELHKLNMPYEPIETALETMIYEEIVIDDDGLLSLKNKRG